MATDDELKCCICLELFREPRCLPCLHTFCRECIQRSLNKNRSLKCPVCRAVHELSEEGASILPVNPYALQELPLKRLQQQESKQECKFCGETARLVAWCNECGVLLCKHCLELHKMRHFKSHFIVEREQASANQLVVVSACLSHPDQVCKYLCSCNKIVCSECLLEGCHIDHEYGTVEQESHKLETRIKGFRSIVDSKREEFSEYWEKAGKAESNALEYSELMKKKVNEVFDGIVASVEAQRNEALQSVSQGVKEIWAQKEKVEVSLAQLDSFTRFADNTDKCTTNASYAAMATQSIKLMEELEHTHGDKAVLDKKKMAIGSVCVEESLHVPLDKLFSLGYPSLKFSPTPGSTIHLATIGTHKITTSVSLVASDLLVLFPTVSIENCKLDVEVEYRNHKIPVEVNSVNQSTWEIIVTINKTTGNICPLVIQCRLSGAVAIKMCCTYTA